MKWIFFGAVRMRAGWRILIFFLFFVFLFLLLILPFSLIFRDEKIQSDRPWDSPVKHAPALMYLAALLIASWLMVRYLDKRSFASLGFALDSGWWKEILYGVAGGFSLTGLLFITALILRGHETSFTSQEPSFLTQSFIRYFLALLIYAAAEETLFRGYPFQALIEGVGKTLSVILLSVVFGALHYFNPHSSMIGVGNTALAGAFLSILYIRRRSLWLPLFVHFSWNFSMGPLFGLPVSGIRFKESLLTTNPIGSDLLSGGEFGLEGSLLTSLILIAVIMILILSDTLKPSQTMSKRWQDYMGRCQRERESN